jgi:transposase-like protein
LTAETETKKPNCPRCGSTETRKFGKIICGNPFREKQRYQCKKCAYAFTEIEAASNEST